MEPYYDSANAEGILKEAKKDYENALIGYRRAKALESWMLENFDPEIRAKYSFNQCVRDVEMSIYFEKNDEISMIRLIDWFKSLKGKKFKVEKIWSESLGGFYYKMSKQFNKNEWDDPEYMIFFRNCFDIDGCKVIEKKRMVKYFITNCEKEKRLI